MASRATQRGFTLVEVMVALSVLLIGSLGMLSLHKAGVRMNTDARTITRATALAQDLLSQMQAWDYTSDARLADGNTANNADYADGLQAFEGTVSATLYDHSDLELTAADYLGVPSTTAQGYGFTRYWNVAEVDTDVNGVVTGRRVAVIVRWEREGSGRRIVLVGFIRNPAVTH